MKEQLEKFCQLVAAGSSYTRAAVESGYANDRASASRRARRPDVAARIQEIRDSLPPIIEPQPGEPAAVIEAGKPNRIREFEQIRDAALAKGHTSAAATAQRDLTKAERVVQAKPQEIDTLKIARQLIPVIDTAMRRGGSAAEVVCRMMGIVNPAEQAALGVPLARRSPAAKGHAKSA